MVAYGSETWTERSVWKALKWRNLDKVKWTDRIRNYVLRWIEEERNVTRMIKKRKTSWMGNFVIMEKKQEAEEEGSMCLTYGNCQQMKQNAQDI